MTANILPIERPWPSRLFVEVTSACNLRFAMCVKQSGPGIADDYLTGATFEMLIPAFPSLETLILNGVGEPLLHPGLEEFVRTARYHLSESASIGFQTNGTLMNYERACSLLDAGTNVISLSVDAADPALFRAMRAGGEADDVNRAADSLERAKKKVGGRRFRWGAELVLSEETLNELPRVIEWVAGRGGEFLLVTHIMPYSKDAVSSVAYDPNADETLALFRRRREEAGEQGLDLSEYYRAKWHIGPVKRREEIIAFLENVVAEISKQGLPQHIPNLASYDEARFLRLEQLFRESRALAGSKCVDLRLPALSPKIKRRCDFIEEGSAFISARGTVHPCYFLWHSFTSHADGRVRPVDALSFGSVNDRPLLEIWNSREFLEYRREVVRYSFPYCGNCSLSPCDYIERHDFERDCLGNRIPCGSCPWSLGVLQCLR